jgi:hypothetical protein
MVWNAGNFTRANGSTEWQDDAALGLGIEPGLHDAQDNDLATGIDQCLNKTGQNAMTGNLNVGGNRVTNVASGTAAAPAICAGNDVDTGIFSPAANELAVSTGGVERVRYDSFGRVGIGISPGYTLHMRRDANDNATTTMLHNNSSGASASCSMLMGSDGGAGIAGIILNSSANTTNAGVNGLAIYNNASGIIRVVATSGGVDLASGATSWSPVSDQRLKKNIEPLAYGLAQINEIEPVRFDYLEDASNDSKRIGFIAQQLQPIVPEAVWGSEETHFRASATELIPILVNAIKELSAKVEALEARLPEVTEPA